MNDKPNILERSFDHLSAIPYLKRIMLVMWIFSTAYLGLVLLYEAIGSFLGVIELRKEWIGLLIKWITVNPLFALMFYLWNQRDKAREAAKK